MRKFFMTMAVLFCLLLQALPAWAAEVYYDGKLLCQSEQIYDAIDGMCVPVRQLFEGLGYEVNWEAEYNAVTLRHPERGGIRLKVGSREAQILSYFDCQLPVTPYFRDGVLYAPLVLLKQEYCGYDVQWQPETTRWLISDKKQSYVRPFADLSREQLTGVTLHFGKKNSSTPIYTAELNKEEIDQLFALLKPLAYLDLPFTGEDIEFSGGNPYDFDLRFADGSKIGFGENACFFYFFRDGEEPVAYLPLDVRQEENIKKFFEQLKEKYLALQAEEK